MIVSDAPSYSVLMSVYFKEKAEYLRDSIDSMLNQSVGPAEFVLVCDGPLTPELDAVIARYLNSEFGRLFKVIRLECNSGLGAALNIGLNECNSQFIARMDSDDISLPDRCEKELAILSTGEIDFVSGTVLEFCDSPSNVFSCRKLPEDTESILEFAKKRNPINHPAVMFKKDAVLKSGGYQPFYLLEDYFLWIRMLSNGFRAQNDGLLLFSTASRQQKELLNLRQSLLEDDSQITASAEEFMSQRKALAQKARLQAYSSFIMQPKICTT